jgi:hypothetical protein
VLFGVSVLQNNFEEKNAQDNSLGQFSLGGCSDYEEVTKAT